MDTDPDTDSVEPDFWHHRQLRSQDDTNNSSTRDLSG